MSTTLFYAPITCALVPYATLLEAGAEFDVQVVNFLQGEHMSPDYLQLNPKHKVPVLVVDNQPMTENVAILQWIARQFPQANLLPDGMDEFRAVSLMSWCASGIHPTLTPNVLPQRYCDLPDSEDAVKACAQKIMHENFAIAESMLDGRTWFFDHFTIPDIYFFWCFRRAVQFQIGLAAYPNCQAHFERVQARDSVSQVLEFEKATLEEWSSNN